MWISRKKWDALVERVDRCSEQSSRASTEAGRVAAAAWIPGALRLTEGEYGKRWEYLPIGGCVSAMANHLGLSFVERDGEPAKPPQVLVVPVKAQKSK